MIAAVYLGTAGIPSSFQGLWHYEPPRWLLVPPIFLKWLLDEGVYICRILKKQRILYHVRKKRG